MEIIWAANPSTCRRREAVSAVRRVLPAQAAADGAPAVVTARGLASEVWRTGLLVSFGGRRLLERSRMLSLQLRRDRRARSGDTRTAAAGARGGQAHHRPKLVRENADTAGVRAARRKVLAREGAVALW